MQTCCYNEIFSDFTKGDDILFIACTAITLFWLLEASNTALNNVGIDGSFTALILMIKQIIP